MTEVTFYHLKLKRKVSVPASQVQYVTTNGRRRATAVYSDGTKLSKFVKN